MFRRRSLSRRDSRFYHESINSSGYNKAHDGAKVGSFPQASALFAAEERVDRTLSLRTCSKEERRFPADDGFFRIIAPPGLFTEDQEEVTTSSVSTTTETEINNLAKSYKNGFEKLKQNLRLKVFKSKIVSMHAGSKKDSYNNEETKKRTMCQLQYNPSRDLSGSSTMVTPQRTNIVAMSVSSDPSGDSAAMDMPNDKDSPADLELPDVLAEALAAGAEEVSAKNQEVLPTDPEALASPEALGKVKYVAQPVDDSSKISESLVSYQLDDEETATRRTYELPVPCALLCLDFIACGLISHHLDNAHEDNVSIGTMGDDSVSTMGFFLL